MDSELERYKSEQAHVYLERIRRMGEDCAGLQEQIDDAYSRVKGIDYSAVRVSSSPNADGIPDAVIALMDKVRDYVVDLSEYEDERHAAHKALMRMGDAVEARALRYRYFLGWKWEKVCTEMDYTWDGMMTLRRRALAHYWDVMPASERDPMHSAI